MGKTNEHTYNRILHPDLSIKEDLDKFCNDMKNHIEATLSWQWKEKAWKEDEKNTFLDSLPDTLKAIEDLKEKKLSPLDMKFLRLIERYYFVISNKPNLKAKNHPEHYASYLSIVRDDIAKFYLECAIQNIYDIAHNPIEKIEGLPEIISICNFFEQKYKNKQGDINWKAYHDEYFKNEGIKLSRMIDDILNKYPTQQKFSPNIPLLFKIFDFHNRYSLEVLFSILTYQLHYSKDQATKLIENHIE